MPTEYEKFIEEHKVEKEPTLSYEDFISEHKIESKSEKDYKKFIKTHATPPKMQELTFGEKHPNLYGLQGVAIALAEAMGKVGWLKYGDYKEAQKLWKMPPKQMKRQLFHDALENVTLLAFFKPGTKPLKMRPVEELPKPISKPTPVGPVEKIHAALKQAKPIRKKQELIYTKERGKRFARGEEASKVAGGGQKGFQARLKEMKGEMTKVEFENIRKNVSQNDIDSLFDMVEKAIPGWDVLPAQKGLAKLFGEFGGKVPTEGELRLLKQVFPEDFIKTLIKKQAVWGRMQKAGYEVLNVPRSVMASFDLSAPFRQGIFLAPSHPIRFTQSFLKMFKQFGSEKAFRAVTNSIRQKKTYGLMQDSGLALTELDSGLAVREEAFMSSLAEKIPIAGRVIRASTRAHMGFLNKLRADVFEDLVNKAAKVGLKPESDPVLIKAIARFVNAGTGRGNLGALENSAVALNSVLFSPRLMSSRLTLLTDVFNPNYYVKTPAFVRKEYLKSLFAFAGMTGTVLGLAKAGGLDVGVDPRSADFAKIKIGNTRIDMMGGFQQYLRFAGQLISGQYISSTTGKLFTLGEGYRAINQWEIAIRQIESKFSPVASFVADWLKQKDMQGRPFNVSKSVAKRFTPMVMQDIYDIAGDEPELLPLSVLGVFGVGLQTYEPRPRKPKGITGIKGIGK